MNLLLHLRLEPFRREKFQADHQILLLGLEQYTMQLMEVVVIHTLTRLVVVCIHLTEIMNMFLISKEVSEIFKDLKVHIKSMEVSHVEFIALIQLRLTHLARKI
jgi:hypothetical protein